MKKIVILALAASLSACVTPKTPPRDGVGGAVTNPNTLPPANQN